MNTNEEVLVKLLEYKVQNDLPAKLVAVQSEWAATHTIGTVTLAADVIVGFETTISEIIISGWDAISDDELLERIDSFPCAFCFVSQITPVSIYEQADSDQLQFLAGIKIVDQGTSRSILEKKVYRFTHAVYDMMREDPFLSGSGWSVQDISKYYSATTPSQPLIKAGMVSFNVTMASVS